jgi:long-chain acyl-CoA synthetase
VAIVAPVTDDEHTSDEELAQYMEANRVELNLSLPSYSQITKIELLREGFQHTPKHSIKRFLYK